MSGEAPHGLRGQEGMMNEEARWQQPEEFEREALSSLTLAELRQLWRELEAMLTGRGGADLSSNEPRATHAVSENMLMGLLPKGYPWFRARLTLSEEGLHRLRRLVLSVLAPRSADESRHIVEKARTAPGPLSMDVWLHGREELLRGLPERMAHIAVEEGGVRALARRAGISHTYVARLIDGKRPTDAPLAALAMAFPKAFDDIPPILQHAPTNAPRVGRPLKNPVGLRARARIPLGTETARGVLHFRIDESGRSERIVNALENIASRFLTDGTTYVVRVEGDADWPIDRGDVVFVQPGGIPRDGHVVLVERRDGTYGFYVFAADDVPTLYPLVKRSDPPVPIADAEIVGIVSGQIHLIGPPFHRKPWIRSQRQRLRELRERDSQP